MPRNPNPNPTNMINLRKDVSMQKKEKTKEVLKELLLIDDPINNLITKAEICRRAKVSKTFIRKYRELSDPIDDAIAHQKQKLSTIRKSQKFSQSSKDIVIESLKRKIQKLEEDNKKLKIDKSTLLGKLSKI